MQSEEEDENDDENELRRSHSYIPLSTGALPKMPSASVAYVLDRDLWDQTNSGERNFWHAYLPELLDQLGLCADEIAPSDLSSTEKLAGCSHLFLGPVSDEQHLASCAARLTSWVQSGGVLIGLSCPGLDELFGVKIQGTVSQPLDDFTQSGFFDLKPVPVTANVHSYLHPSQKLLTFSDVRLVSPTDAHVVGSYHYANGRLSPYAAITQRPIDRGWAFYFAFDVPKTIWVLHQGRPVDRDYDGDGYFRTGDARVIGSNEEEVLYADEILLVIQNMVARRPLPFVCASPPVGGQVPNALLYWGGDDEAADGLQIQASNFMATRGLPYHMNIMPREGRFHLSREEAEQIWRNGHEIAVHYNHTEREPDWSFTETDVQTQAQLFYEAFGRRSECSVNHCVTWVGWAEPAKWMAQCGGTGDNSRIHSATPPMNPANQIGFSFGTALPFYFYDDWRAGNERIDFVCEPITAYEVGYRPDRFDPAMVHKAVDLAAHYRLTLDMFYHPCNIAWHETCRAAIDEVSAYAKRRGLRLKHMGNDELARWWRQRSASSVSDVTVSDAGVSFRTGTDHADGIVVKIPLQTGEATQCSCSGHDLTFENTFELGQNWAYVVVPSGESHVEIATR